MARKQTVLVILFASPFDVPEEIEIATDVLEEFNTTWSRQLGITLELSRWDTDVSPGVGSDPQQVINDRLPAYDILLSVFWTRVGTPTPRAESGTIEEFERAYIRFQQSPDQLQFLMYFSSVPADPQSIDADQLSKVRRFQRSVSDRGVLYSTYKTRDEFATKLRTDLARLVQSWNGGWPPPARSSAPKLENTEEERIELQPGASKLESIDTKAPSRVDATEEEDTEGLLDLVEAGQSAFETATAAAKEISEATEILGQHIQQRADIIIEMQKEGRSETKAVKHHINLAAADMVAFAETVTKHVPVFASETTNGLNSLSKAAILGADFSGDKRSLSEVLDSIDTMAKGIQSGRASTDQLRNSISGLPRMTTEFQRAKKRALAVLDSFDRALQDGLDLCEQVKATLRRIISHVDIAQAE